MLQPELSKKEIPNYSIFFNYSLPTIMKYYEENMYKQVAIYSIKDRCWYTNPYRFNPTQFIEFVPYEDYKIGKIKHFPIELMREYL